MDAVAFSIRASATAEIKQAGDSADRGSSAARESAARQIADAEVELEPADAPSPLPHTASRAKKTSATARGTAATRAEGDK
jgi:hypothetical protein